MVDLIDYERTVCRDTWRVLREMVSKYKERKLKVSFFNSTPQGGGGKNHFDTSNIPRLTMHLLFY